METLPDRNPERPVLSSGHPDPRGDDVIVILTIPYLVGRDPGVHREAEV
jgi:hypothetical protein